MTTSSLGTFCLQTCCFERGQEWKGSGTGSSFSRSWSSQLTSIPSVPTATRALRSILPGVCLRSPFQINCFDISVWHQQLILPTPLRLWWLHVCYCKTVKLIDKIFILFNNINIINNNNSSLTTQLLATRWSGYQMFARNQKRNRHCNWKKRNPVVLNLEILLLSLEAP